MEDLIDMAQKELICKRLSPFLELDKHAKNGVYMIRSLYFDDYFNTAYEEKDAGVLERKKYRIRVYNCSDSSIKLERKKKFGSYIFNPVENAEPEIKIDYIAEQLGLTDESNVMYGLIGAIAGKQYRNGNVELYQFEENSEINCKKTAK